MSFLGTPRVGLGWLYNRQLPLYHGTSASFPKPKLNQLGILWLAPNPVVAEQYGQRHYAKTPPRLWRIWLKPSAKILDLSDLSIPIVAKLREEINAASNFPIPAEMWVQSANFALIESYQWIRGWLRARKIDGVAVKDKVATTDTPHDSIALFSLAAIESAEEIPVSGYDYKKMTIGEIEDHIERWTPAATDYRRA